MQSIQIDGRSESRLHARVTHVADNRRTRFSAARVFRALQLIM